jgi:hypothetical protein
VPAASRYFGATPYLYYAHDAAAGDWLSVFGSMGDTFSVVRTPAAARANQAPALAGTPAAAAQQQPGGGARLPADQAAAAGGAAGGPAAGDQALQVRLNTAQLRVPEQPVLAALFGGGSDGSASPAAADLAAPPPAAPDQQQVPPQAAAFDAFTVFLMGANPVSVAAAAEAIHTAVQAAAARTGLRAPEPSYMNVLTVPGVLPDACTHSLAMRRLDPVHRGCQLQHAQARLRAVVPIAGRPPGASPGASWGPPGRC